MSEQEIPDVYAPVFLSLNPEIPKLMEINENVFEAELRFVSIAAKESAAEYQKIVAAGTQSAVALSKAEDPDRPAKEWDKEWDAALAAMTTINNSATMRAAVAIRVRCEAVATYYGGALEQAPEPLRRTFALKALYIYAENIGALWATAYALSQPDPKLEAEIQSSVDLIIDMAKPITDYLFVHMMDDERADEPEAKAFRSKFGPAKTRIH